MKLYTLSCRLNNKNRNRRFQLRWLNGDGQTPTESRFQSVLEAVDLFLIKVTGQDDLSMTLEQRVKSMVELVLGALLAGEKLNIINK